MSEFQPRSVRPLLALAAAVGAGLLAACGSTSVGNDSLFSFTPQPVATASPSSTAAAASTASTPPPAATQAPAATPPPATKAPTPRPATPVPTAAAPHFAITINGDTSSTPGFDPPSANVYTGTVVVWTNRDTVARSVVAQGGAFSSPPIPPGGSYSWTAAAPGTVNYGDGTRPYISGQIKVVAH